MKICSICKKEKKLEEFSRRKDRANGLARQSRCKACFKEYNALHTDRIKKYAQVYREKNASEINNYHSKYNSTRDSGLYMKWTGLIKRCDNESENYKYSYLDRGIRNEWKTYADFKKDMYESFLEHLEKFGKLQTSLDRINNDGNYNKENCRWADWKMQNNNKRKYRNLGNWGKRKGRKFPKK